MTTYPGPEWFVDQAILLAQTRLPTVVAAMNTEGDPDLVLPASLTVNDPTGTPGDIYKGGANPKPGRLPAIEVSIATGDAGELSLDMSVARTRRPLHVVVWYSEPVWPTAVALGWRWAAALTRTYAQQESFTPYAVVTSWREFIRADIEPEREEHDPYINWTMMEFTLEGAEPLR